MFQTSENKEQMLAHEYVPNIGSIARINYAWQMVYIRGVYTHKDYDEGKWKHGCESV